ncbi:non-ribosomal peptide synthetase terminal domain of unknown function [Amycolatopsis arida]|uniref:Carrier domain-containing protein n=2 Tax=Amycolatopsis arida TaxID=587909 RepID=A0A1I5SED1_9PSEU|nr:non-ribosomal peptide synthetase-like protein [Amycolatopsis arida]SFP69088.1 non-ribosomal peptide synthetase terminal domain of unknown function [Amycolatopsis arida]
MTAVQPARSAPATAGLAAVFDRGLAARPDAVALDCAGTRLTYTELDARANRLAHHLRARGVRPGDRVGLRLPRSVGGYVALLAVVRAGAAFVPIDPAAPADRVAFVVEDAGIRLLLTGGPAGGIPGPVLPVAEAEAAAAGLPATPPDLPPDPDELAYVIYTSGSTGRPKGVEVTRAAIGHFLDVVPRIYRIRPDDRVYQGMTWAFDFSLEEIWPTWAVGATLVAGADDDRRIGAGLTGFLAEQRITVLYCVPTVLATIEHDLPELRTLVVGGEACSAELVRRWSRPGRRMLNTYGPTEATVTATWSELRPDRPVTIGVPLPGYLVDVRDDALAPVPPGAVGEICVAGRGVARGYRNLPERTAERFVERAGTRIYRTGDLGRLLPNGEIAYLGRVDSEVKVRGHRVDLQEIESVLLADPAVTGAAVRLLPAGELAGYVTVAGPVDRARLRDQLHGELRRRLPPYMVPAYLEVVADLPMLPSGKVDRAALPAPRAGRLVGGARGDGAPPATARERAVAAVWARVLDVPEVSATADFFTDLGGHSLLATRVVSRLRDVAPGLSVAALYRHRTVRELARQIGEASAGDTGPPPLRHRARGVVAAGGAQATAYAAVLLALSAPLAALVAGAGAVPPADLLWRGELVALGGLLVGRLVLPVAGVRLLTARLRPGRYPLWGPAYLRIWLARQLVALAPLATLSGSPLLPPYLRALGARVGQGGHVATAGVPLPPFTTLGAGASVGYGARLEPLHVERGWAVLRPVTVGAGSVVGTNAVVAGGEVGDGAELADHSLVAPGQRLPAGRRWAGTPAADRGRAEGPAGPAGRWSGWLLAGFALGWLAVELVPVAATVPALVLLCRALRAGAVAVLWATLAAGPLFVLATCLLVALGRRAVLRRTPTGTFPLRSALGLRKYVSDKLLETSLRTTGTLYATLYTVPWLRLLGARIGPRSEVSTVAHLDPDLLRAGPECFLADQAAVGPAAFRHGRMTLGRTELARRSFVGNAALVPAGTRLGAETLVGAHSLAPHGAVAEGTSWLGSPPIRLPRRQESPRFGAELTFRPSRARVAGRLAIELFRVVLPATVLAAAALGAFLALVGLARHAGVAVTVLATPLVLAAAGLAVVLVVVLLKWLLVGRYAPRAEPLWSTFVRRSELVTGLYEDAAVPALLGALAGTPMLPALLRLFGARMGRRVWLASTYLTEFDLVRVGDDAAVGPATSLQTHLFEDRVMKMSTVRVEPGASVGCRGVVLYDAVVGAGARVDPLSLVLKGERLGGGTHWRGVPVESVGS